MNYIDLVIVKNVRDCYTTLLQAPAFTHLHKGDEVIAQSERFTVEDSLTVVNGGEEHQFIARLFDSEAEIVKIEKMARFEELTYEEETDNG